MKKLLTILLLVHITIFSFAQTNISSGEVSGIWTMASSPYNINGDITLSTSTLSIEAGVDIIFQGSYSFTVSGLGNIIALGSKDNEIMFTAISSWSGLRFETVDATADSSLFEFCTFQRSRKIYNSSSAAGIADRDGGGIFISSFDKVRLENCIISNNHSSAVSGSWISGSSYGGGVFLLDAAIKITNCKITDNSASFSMASKGGGIYLQNSAAEITNCNISNNTASSGFYSRGGGLYLHNSDATINNCNVINNNSSAPNSPGCSSYGGGLYLYNSVPNIINGTIVNNSTGYSYSSGGGGIYSLSSTDIYVHNSILWDNTSYSSPSQISGDASLFNCCILGYGTNLSFTNCIHVDPLFVNVSNNDYTLQSSSPCIDNGNDAYITTTTDYYGNQRIFGSSVDIGSYEYIITYTVTFNDWDGTQLDQQTVEHGSAASAPTDPTRTGYSFTGWSADFSNVTSNLTVTAEYGINSYIVTFNDWDGTQLDQQTVEHGSAASAPTIPTRTGYSFTGWSADFSNVTSNLTVIAEYGINSYIVTFNDWDGTQLDQQTVEHGSAASAPTDPTRTGYTFTGWDTDISNVTTALNITAEYSLNSYTVTFNDWDGTQLDQQTVNHGSVASAPSDPTRTGYTFTGWDTDFNNVTSALTVTAEYSLNSYTVTFNDWDGTQLDQQTVNHGSAASAPSDPTRTGYTFTVWDTDFSSVTSNLTVTAEYIITTGINGISEIAYKYYPNPVIDKLSIEIPKNSNINKIKICNIIGGIIYSSSELEESLLVIDLNNCQSGVLLIKVTDKNGNIFTKIIIKQ